MSNSTVEMMPETRTIVSDRERVWDDLDALSKRSIEIQELEHRIGSALGDTSTIQPFTSDRQPPEEISHAIAEIRRELEKVDSLTREVVSRKQAIADIESRMMAIYFGGAVVLLIFFIWLVSLFS